MLKYIWGYKKILHHGYSFGWAPTQSKDVKQHSKSINVVPKKTANFVVKTAREIKKETDTEFSVDMHA
jgi:hypothetical protein